MDSIAAKMNEKLQISDTLVTFRKILLLIPTKERARLYLLILGAVATALLDMLALVGIYAFANLASQSVAGGGQPPEISIQGNTFLITNQILGALGISVIFLFFLKSILSAISTRSLYRFLKKQDIKIFKSMFDETLSAPVGCIQEFGQSKAVGLTVLASDTFSVRVIGSIFLLLADISLLVVLLITSIFVDPVPALIAFVVLSLTVVVLDRTMKAKLHAYGKTHADSVTATYGEIDQSISGIREFRLRASTASAVEKVTQIRAEGVRARTELAFIVQIPKYALELSLIVACAFTAIVQYERVGGAAAAGGLLLLVAIGFRMLPSISRIQASLSDLRSALPIALDSLEFLDTLAIKKVDFDRRVIDLGLVVDERNASNLTGELVRLEKISYSYDDTINLTLKYVSASINRNTLTAVVGPSGSGKSTLLDLICGFRLPQEGNMFTGGFSIFHDLKKWQSSIAFVSQDIYIFHGSVTENVAFGVSSDEVDIDKVTNALEMAQLLDWVSTLEGGLDTVLSAGGTSISGGQRQRIGIARALYQESQIIILDEATSALDAETEDSITRVLSSLRERITIIAITHRLSTVRHADDLIYMSNGEILGTGTFEQLATRVPGFARAAEISGLS